MQILNIWVIVMKYLAVSKLPRQLGTKGADASVELLTTGFTNACCALKRHNRSVPKARIRLGLDLTQ